MVLLYNNVIEGGRESGCDWKQLQKEQLRAQTQNLGKHKSKTLLELFKYTVHVKGIDI